MEYCKSHFSKQKTAKKAGAAALIVVGVLLVLFGGFGLFAFTVAEHGPGLGGYLLVTLVLVVPGVLCLGLGVRKVQKNRSLADPENTRLVQSIRRQLPADQAKLPLEQVFALVDRDLERGQLLGNAVVGQEWVLVADLAVRASNIRGIFQTIRSSRSSGVYVSQYEITVCDERRECATVVFLDAKKAEVFLNTLYALAPNAARGGDAELMQLMFMSKESLQMWNETVLKR